MMTDQQPRFRSEYQRFFYQAQVESKAWRDANGVINERLDALYEKTVIQGIFPDGSQIDDREDISKMDGATEIGHRPEAGARAGNQYGTFQVKYASDRQQAFIQRLFREKDTSKATARASEIIEQARPYVADGKINKKHASALIDCLMGCPDLPKAAQKAAPRKLNKFGGRCIKCQNYVAAEQGWLTKDPKTDKWASEHKNGECPAKAAPIELPEVPAGRFAIVGGDGTVDFYQIDRPDKGKWKDYIFLSLLLGSTDGFNRSAIKNPKAKATIMGKIQAAGIEESARLFGQKTNRCGHCLADLTNPQSRAAGYGGTCAAKHGYWYPSESEALKILGEGKDA